MHRSVTKSPVVFINRSIIPCVKLPNWWSPILNSTHFEFYPFWISLTNDIHQVEVNQVKFSHRWVDFISGWNSKWVEFKMGRIQNGRPSIWEFHTGNNRSVSKHYRGICNWAGKNSFQWLENYFVWFQVYIHRPCLWCHPDVGLVHSVGVLLKGRTHLGGGWAHSTGAGMQACKVAWMSQHYITNMF